MPTVINGSSGVDKVQASSVTTAALQAGAVTPAKTEMGALPSMVRMSGGTGHGSTNTMIRRFTSILSTQGTDITVTQSATLGDSFTINRAGVYAISYSDSFSGAGNLVGLSLNTTQPTTQVNNLTNAGEFLGVQQQAAGSYRNSLAVTLFLPAGSVIRAHTDGGGNGSSSVTSFIITRVA